MAGTREPLTRERITVAALEMIDADGLDSLSMRKLGAALGVEAMSLYNHVANKQDLLDGVLEQLYLQIQVPGADEGSWQDQVRLLARSFRQVGNAHPEAFSLFARHTVRSLTGADVLRRCYDIFVQAGLDEESAILMFHSAASVMIGFVLLEHGEMRELIAGDGLDVEALPEEFADEADFLRACATLDLDAKFEAGIDLFLAGVEAQLA